MSNSNRSFEIAAADLAQQLFEALALLSGIKALLEEQVDRTSSFAPKDAETEVHTWDTQVFSLMRMAELRIASTSRVLCGVPGDILVAKGGAA